MLVRIITSAITGIDAIPIDVEVRIRKQSKPSFNIIGLGDNAVREARDRVISAIKFVGFSVPDGILVNLAPAEVKKEGASFDLPIAVGILAGSGQINADHDFRAFHGELALDGRIKPIRGTVALTIEAVRCKMEEIVVPLANRSEAALIPGIRVVGVESLSELASYLNGEIVPDSDDQSIPLHPRPSRRLSEVWGQEIAKRALMVAAAGGHNLLMIGPPGCGKSMLAERFPSILPPLSTSERLETVKVHSIAGYGLNGLLAGERPFRNPHHVISEAGLIGGGSQPRPGEISLAHNGVLFLDEFPEYRRSVIEALRGPIENGFVLVSRAKSSQRFPASFQLLAAMNPCPCGRLGGRTQKCKCSQVAISKYLQKLSQPILDRIDIHVELEAVPFSVISGVDKENVDNSEYRWRQSVLQAREKQMTRSGHTNNLLTLSALKRFINISSSSRKLLEESTRKFGISARGFVRILRVALTIADLDGDSQVADHHISEALSYRCLERLEKFYGIGAG